MIQRIFSILIVIVWLAACGAPAPTEAPDPGPPLTEDPATAEPPAFQSLEAPTRAPTQTEPVLQPTPSPVPVTPTDTALPTLDLPTEAVNAPAQMVWDGAPTYPAESVPGFVFRVTYDPEVWALTSDQFGFAALGHRHIPGCVLSVTAGRGLPANMTVEHEVLDTGSVTFDVGNVYENRILKFVTYTGGNATIITAFQLSIEQDVDPCRMDAVRVLSTLRAVPASQATPTALP